MNSTSAAITTLLIAVITITPLCGMLFGCGCTWPGLGLDVLCNIHDPAVLHPCPWCSSTFWGYVSVSFALLGGTLATISSFNIININSLKWFASIAIGSVAYAILASISAMFSALAMNHPVPIF